MTKRQAVKIIERARKRAMDSANANRGGESLFERGLAYEGYDGGYVQALDDCLLVLTGGGALPNRNSYWGEA